MRARTERSDSAPVSSSVDLAVPIDPVGLPELELLHLARRRPWDRVDEIDGRRRLVAGDVPLAVLDDGCLVDVGTGRAYDDGFDRLAPLVVRHADDGAFG